MDDRYHYPPELYQLLIDGIPRLVRSKVDVFSFFRGAGVPDTYLSELRAKLSRDRDSVNKFEIARTVLAQINEAGDEQLRARREIVRRVSQWEDFSTCWPNDQMEARGFVAQIQNVVNVKDSFTRMSNEREQERRSTQKEQERERSERQERRNALDSIKADLFSLFGMDDAPQKRGTLLESVLNRLFSLDGILVRESFRRVSDVSGRVLEQIDGVVSLNGEVYLVEMKWLKDNVSVEDVSRHITRIYHRGSARGIFISETNFTESSMETCKDALQTKVVVLARLEEIVRLLDSHELTFADFFEKKVQAAIIDRDPFVSVLTR